MKMMHNKIRRLFNNRLMIVISLSFIICHLSFNILNAQTYTQRLQKNTDGKAKVTIHHSKAIDDLVNGPKVNIQTVAIKNVETATTIKTTVATQRKHDVVAKDKVTVQHQHDNAIAQRQQDTVALQTADTTSVQKKVKKKMVMVYRVQAYAGGNSRKDRRTAEQIGNQLRTLFPSESVYVHFYTPRWICRMGNYRTYEEAHHALQEVKKMGYTAATIVKGKTAVAY